MLRGDVGFAVRLARVTRRRRRSSPQRRAAGSVRVLLLTAPVGEGHQAAARALAAEIRHRNDRAEVVVFDVLPALGRPLRWLLNDAYRWQLRAAPWLFGLLFAALRR